MRQRKPPGATGRPRVLYLTTAGARTGRESQLTAARVIPASVLRP
jgi:hypothetical protein